MVKALFDTNILVDYLNGNPAAKAEIEGYDERLISPVSWMEVLVGTPAEQESLVRAWLATFGMVAIDEGVAGRAVAIRKSRRIKLPDALTWASAQIQGALLVTRNSKDFPADAVDVRIPPYQ